MTKDEFELLGFTTEILPSGYMNIYNKDPFYYNGTVTICCWSNRYFRTTNHKTLESLLNNLRELRTIERVTLKSKESIKEKTKRAKSTQVDPLEPLTNQDLGAFLTGDSVKDTKPKRTRKTKTVSG